MKRLRGRPFIEEEDRLVYSISTRVNEKDLESLMSVLDANEKNGLSVLVRNIIKFDINNPNGFIAGKTKEQSWTGHYE